MSGTLVERLRGSRRVFLDSMTLIYFIEEHAVYRPILRPVFELVASGGLFGLSSYITLLEVLVRPLRKGRRDLAAAYKDRLTQSGHFALFPVDRFVAEQGAEIRARFDFQTPDAIQLAVAIRHQADAFVTNDRRLKRFDGLEVLLLDDFNPTPSQE
jgi:predicted nucleic acid-binding protein